MRLSGLPRSSDMPISQSCVWDIHRRKEQIVHAGRKRAALLRETKELASDSNEIEFHVEDEREELAPYNQTIEEADPDNHLMPKRMTEIGIGIGRAMKKKRERNETRKLESEKQGGNKPANLPAPDLNAANCDGGCAH
jgi:hypothetical protein